MNLPWFVGVGRKRSALCAAESTAKRDKWVSFITKSLGKDTEDESRSDAVNPLFSADNALEKEMNDKLDDANHANPAFGQQQSPINLISGTQCKHTVIMGNEEYEHSPLKFQYPQFVKNCTIMNNGYT